MKTAQQQYIQNMRNEFKAFLQQMGVEKLHPPFLPKTITHFRQSHYSVFKHKFNIDLQDNLPESLRTISTFMEGLDQQALELLLEQIREPYIKKMQVQNYAFNSLDFQQIEKTYQLKAEIEEMVTSASEWLLQIQLTYDLVQRAHLYYDVHTKLHFELLKEKLKQNQKWTLTGCTLGIFRKSTIFLLRRISSLLDIYGKSTLQSILPSLLLLVYSIVGGGVTLPWKIVLPKMNIAAIIGLILGPIVINNVVDNMTKNDLKNKMKKITMAFSQTSQNLLQYNERLHNTIQECAESAEEFRKKRQLLIKYLEELDTSQQSIKQYDEQHFDKIKKQVESQFAKYYQIQSSQAGWTLLLTEADYQKYVTTLANLQQSLNEYEQL